MPFNPKLPSELQLKEALVAVSLNTYTLHLIFPTTLHGLEHLPSGAALLIGNHGPLAMDTGLLIHAMHRNLRRIPRTLGDSFMFQNPVSRAFSESWGGVEATPEAARTLLDAGEWVLVYPGGARETMRSPEERYQLRWHGRVGFARTALHAQVPIVPVACVGLDESLHQVLTREEALETAGGKWLARVLGKDYVPPVFVPRARSTQYHYWFGEPIWPKSIGAGDEVSDEDAVALQHRVRLALEELIEHGREVRRSRLASS